MSDTTAPALVALGFTSLEAEVYTWLLEESPVTGYRIAQALGKPAPNVYKALESLEAKGAVMVDEGKARQCRPVPPEELLNHLERRFRSHRREAEELLARIHAPKHDDRVYRLRSADQVRERARSMLGTAREVALIDAFPAMLEALRPDLEAAAARGVVLAAIAYGPVEMEGVTIVRSPRGGEVRERWPGEWLNVVIDGQEHLVALLGEGGQGVRQAIWSGSTYLSWVYHSAVAAELILDDVERLLEEGASREEIARRHAELSRLKALEAPGYRALRREIEGNRQRPGT
jgi:sugar-specific transcriptional regulator TrmB